MSSNTSLCTLHCYKHELEAQLASVPVKHIRECINTALPRERRVNEEVLNSKPQQTRTYIDKTNGNYTRQAKCCHFNYSRYKRLIKNKTLSNYFSSLLRSVHVTASSSSPPYIAGNTTSLSALSSAQRMQSETIRSDTETFNSLTVQRYSDYDLNAAMKRDDLKSEYLHNDTMNCILV